MTVRHRPLGDAESRRKGHPAIDKAAEGSGERGGLRVGDQGADLGRPEHHPVERSARGGPLQPLAHPQRQDRENAKRRQPVGPHPLTRGHDQAGGQGELALGAREQPLELGHHHQEHHQDHGPRHHHQDRRIHQRGYDGLAKRFRSVEGFG
jgi:hypothetical protein